MIANGASVGLDAGTSLTIAQALPCTNQPGDPTQTFDVVQGDQQGFPDAFPIRSYASDTELAHELCLQPYIAKEPSFDAVAFETPSGEIAVVAMNAVIAACGILKRIGMWGG